MKIHVIVMKMFMKIACKDRRLGSGLGGNCHVSVVKSLPSPHPIYCHTLICLTGAMAAINCNDSSGRKGGGGVEGGAIWQKSKSVSFGQEECRLKDTRRMYKLCVLDSKGYFDIND